MKNLKAKELIFDSNFKISKEYRDGREKNNYYNILEDDNRAKEFEKMLESINNNLRIRNELKQEQNKKDKKLMRILNAETKRFMVDDLIEEDDIKLSDEEIKFLNQIEYDTSEASFYEKNLELIENINDPFKKRIVLDSLSYIEETDKLIIFQRINSDFFNLLKQIESHSLLPTDKLVLEEGVRKINYKNFMNILNVIYKNYFELFYSIAFSDLQNYFTSNIYLESNKEKIINLSKRSDHNLENEDFFFNEKIIDRLNNFEDLERSIFFLSFIKKESYRTIRALLDNYLNLPFMKKAAKIIKETNASNQLFLTKKMELFRLIPLLNISWEEGINKIEFDDQNKIKSLPSSESKEIEYKTIIKSRIENLIIEIENLPKKPSEFQNNSVLLFVDCNKILVTYDGVIHILNNLNISVDNGELVFLHSEGSECNFILDILNGKDSFLYGDIFIDGKNISILDKKQKEKIFEQKIGNIAFNFFTPENDISVHDYIFNDINKDLWTEDEISDVLNETSISSLMEFGMSYLENIELIRVEIAKNILLSKKIIILKDINNLVDEYNFSFVERILEITAAKYNIAYISTHDKSYELSDNSRKIYIKDGKIIKDNKRGNNDWI